MIWGYHYLWKHPNRTLVGSAFRPGNVQQGPHHWLLLVRPRLWRQRKCSGEPPVASCGLGIRVLWAFHDSWFRGGWGAAIFYKSQSWKNWRFSVFSHSSMESTEKQPGPGFFTSSPEAAHNLWWFRCWSAHLHNPFSPQRRRWTHWRLNTSNKSPEDRVVGPLANGLYMAYKWGFLTTYQAEHGGLHLKKNYLIFFPFQQSRFFNVTC